MSDEEKPSRDDAVQRLTGERFSPPTWWRRRRRQALGPSSPEAIEEAANRWRAANKRTTGGSHVEPTGDPPVEPTGGRPVEEEGDEG